MPPSQGDGAMAVKMLTAMAGDTWAVKPGDIYESDPAHEKRLIDSGLAEAVETTEQAAKNEPVRKTRK